MATKAVPLQRKLMTAVRADPKKAAVLTILVIALSLMWVRRLAGGNSGPQSSNASIAARSDKENAARHESAQRGGGDSGASYIEWRTAPIQPLARNFFAIRFERFPLDGSRPAPLAERRDTFWDDLAKSLSSQADHKKQRQILIENLQMQAGQLRLQTTLMGPTPRAVVNGMSVGEGDVVAEFRVFRIEARRIIVEREGIKLEIPMRFE
jgi:hypothetical protein